MYQLYVYELQTKQTLFFMQKLCGQNQPLNKELTNKSVLSKIITFKSIGFWVTKKIHEESVTIHPFDLLL